ncbi:MAG TPA: ATP-binding cassette domain-containing protein, partial [Nitrospiria bacterium]
NLELQRGERVVLVGPNGAGKSTLLKILAGELACDRGERVLGHNVSRAYYAQHQLEQLNPKNTVLQEIIAAAPLEGEPFLRAILGRFLFTGDDVKKKVSVLSGGEKSRLALAKMLIVPSNFLLMDEPTNHLDIPSRDILEEALEKFPGTLCFITHDRHFIRSVSNRIIEVVDGGVTVYPGDYDYYLYKKSGEAEDRLKGPSPSPNSAKPAGETGKEGAVKTRKTKDQKRAEAETRNRSYQKTKKLKQDLKRVEADLAASEEELKKLTGELADPALYQDQEKFSETMKAHKQAEKTVGRLGAEWEKLSVELEKVEGSL